VEVQVLSRAPNQDFPQAQKGCGCWQLWLALSPPYSGIWPKSLAVAFNPVSTASNWWEAGAQFVRVHGLACSIAF
jgi:hypothetical protein